MATSYAQDPVYQQWLGTLGFTQADATRKADDARTQVTNQADFAREGLGIQRDRSIEGIAGGFENRLMTRSGEHLRRRAEALRDSNRAFGALELDVAGRMAGIEGGLAEEVARLLKDKKVPKISEMFQEAKQVGQFRLVACSAGLEYMGVDQNTVAKNVDEVMGLPTILSLTAGAETTLFI